MATLLVTLDLVWLFRLGQMVAHGQASLAQAYPRLRLAKPVLAR